MSSYSDWTPLFIQTQKLNEKFESERLKCWYAQFEQTWKKRKFCFSQFCSNLVEFQIDAIIQIQIYNIFLLFLIPLLFPGTRWIMVWKEFWSKVPVCEGQRGAGIKVDHERCVSLRNAKKQINPYSSCWLNSLFLHIPSSNCKRRQKGILV